MDLPRPGRRHRFRRPGGGPRGRDRHPRRRRSGRQPVSRRLGARPPRCGRRELDADQPPARRAPRGGASRRPDHRRRRGLDRGRSAARPRLRPGPRRGFPGRRLRPGAGRGLAVRRARSRPVPGARTRRRAARPRSHRDSMDGGPGGRGGVRLDLGATAKAWTADRAASAVAAATGAGCLVSIGGDVAVAGTPPEGGWRVRVEDVTGDPGAQSTGPATVVTVHDGGLATSSVVARRWQRDGVWLHHLLDPRTGLPPVPVWRTVSAAAGSCVDANILSTAAVVRGHRVWPWLRGVRLPVRLVTADGQVLTAGGWPEGPAA